MSTTGLVLVDNEFYRLTSLPGESILRLVRSSVPFRSAEDVDRACTPVQTALDVAGRPWTSLLLDSRRAPGRNDPAYEEWFRPHRDRMVQDLRRVALVMGSVVGRLHAERLTRDYDRSRTALRIFLDEDAALEYLRSPTG